jgi:hypothetical protein
MKHVILRPAAAILLSAAFTAAIGCGGSSPGSTEASGGAAATGGGSSTPAPAVKTASLPDNACGYVPAADVEQIVGKLSGPPSEVGGECVYPLAQKSEAFAALAEMRQRFREGKPDDDSDFKDIVRVGVDVTADVTGDLAIGAVAKMFAKELGQNPSEAGKKDPPPAGWDAVTGLPYTFVGRAGHIQVSVFSPPEIKQEMQMAVAAKFRDAIPDLPFPTDNPYQVVRLGGDRNPCDLLTRAEAEAVLGPLVVAPYRAIEDSSLVYEKGHACAFYTAGHRAFVITPEFTDGASTYKLSKGLGGLIGAVVPLEKAAIEGPWDEGRVDGTTGALMFLKGDRYLRVDYLTSSTDRAGALKLAATAMQRLGS